MRRHAKASSAGSTLGGRGQGLGSRIRGAFATRGGSGDADGSGAPSHRLSRLALGFLVAAIALLALASSALAVTTRVVTESLGADGNSPGTAFIESRGVAFDQANKRLYVLDTATPTIYGFSASTPGTYTPLASPFPLAGLEASGATGDIAVDNTGLSSAGRIYYSTTSTTISGFTPAGAPLGSPFPISPATPKTLCGAAVDSAGNLGVSNSPLAVKKIFRYDSTGSALTPIDVSAAGNGRACDLAFDSNNDVYFTLNNGTAVYRFSAAANYSAGSATLIESDTAPATPAKAVAVDTANHHLYVVHSEFVNAYDSTGKLLYVFYGPSGSTFNGIAVDQSSDRIYVSDIGHQRIQVFGPPTTLPDASAVVQPATNVTATTADLSGTVFDNSSLPTNWRIETSPDGITWTTKASGTTPGGGSGVTVSGTATGLHNNATYHFRIVTNKGAGSAETPSGELTFHTLTIPDAIAMPSAATNVTATGADLSGTVNDNGALPTNWRLQVSPNGTSWSDVSSGTTAGGQSSVPVAGSASGLEPNTLYHVRILTNKGPGTDDVGSSQVTFKTLTAPPVVSDVGAIEVGDLSARLVGVVDPQSSDTTYVFEYGVSPALDHATAPVEISGPDPLVVSQVIGGLQPNTTYSLKLVATGAGSAASSVVTFKTRASPLPSADSRAYEQVTPPFKNFASKMAAARTSVAWDGHAVGFAAVTGFGDPAGENGWINVDYRAVRGPGGWKTGSITPPFCEFDAADPESDQFGQLPSPAMLSPNLDYGFLIRPEGPLCTAPSLDPAAPQGKSNYYREDFTQTPTAYSLLSPAACSFCSYGSHPGQFTGGGDDWSHMVYVSFLQQTPDAPPGIDSIFDWHDGSISLVTKDVANVPFTTSSSMVRENTNSISSSGDRIFFQHPALSVGPTCATSSCELYMRQNATTTYDVSESECTSACGAAAGDVFQRANPAGNKVLFSSAEKLTNDPTPSNVNLYLYTHSANPATNPNNLTLLSEDSEPADGSSADFRGVLGMSDDGETVYFVANGQLVAGKPTAVGPKVYRWRSNGGSPTLSYLATLTSGTEDLQNWQLFSNIQGPEENLVTPDGNVLLLHTPVRLDPVADRDGSGDVYRWTGESGWSCLSCQFPGLPSNGDSTFVQPGFGEQSYEQRIVMTDDGQRIFFGSPDALVPADTNGEAGCSNANIYISTCQDVYEWHDGRVNLISSGTGKPAILMAASRSGNDVFFLTTNRLVGWDTDEIADVYDARVGGGFPEPPAQGAPCEGDACHGAGTQAPAVTGAGTAVFQGPGNESTRSVEPKGCPAGKRKVHRRGKVTCVKKHHRRAGHKRRTGK